MKTAISIPDSIFQAAENLAQRLGLSRSELYVKAMNEYLNSHKNQNVTKKLNEVYASNDSTIDNDVLSMQIRSIPKENWE
jgi:metal-responsive CopG/Arc/MetJ family transcriptional regulator